ncbi:Histone-binding protein rbbp4 [Podila verticillata]|nr:Histone-binding protein rbbp4 [Podila verticillata]
MSFQPQRSFGPVKPWLLAKNIPKKVSAVRLSNVLGLGRDDKFFDRASESSDAELVRDIKISLFEATVPHCMSIIAKHNYTTLEGTVIRIELAPLAKYNDMHEVYVEVGAEVTLKAAFDARQAIIKPGRDARRVVSVQGKRLTGYYIIMGADELFYYEQKYIKDHDVKFIWIKNVGPQVPDFWVPPVIKGNVIAVPINVASAASASVGRAVTYGESRPMPSRVPPSKPTPVVAPLPPKPFNDTPETQRAKHSQDKSPERNIFQPGQIKPRNLIPPRSYPQHQSPAKIHADWCNSAFVAYETLYNMSARSDQGKVSISSIAWGSQLDISTFRMHYGSKFTAAIEPKKPVPVVSSSTVEMRQYGDKDSAAEVLSIRHLGKVADHSDAFTEGINMTSKGTILSMKCLESGHLVTSTEQQGLHVWDMKENTEKGRAPIVLDPNDRRFSIRGNKLRTAIPHPLTGCEWNPHNPHEFMTTSVNAIRIWDARKMSDDVHCRFYDIGDKIQKAQWSPHKPDVFGILGQDGLLRITKLQIPPSPPSYLEELNSEDLFIHLGHTLCVTDFAWCPYLEDVICTVAAGFDKEPGGIQVWRPRNLYDLDDNEEP